jgi:hypothetical protein
MSSTSAWTAERIRTLRGNQTRAQFAAALGVSALTVYRWELPDGAQEARRPRGEVGRRLEALASGKLPPVGRSRQGPAPPPAESPLPEELAQLLPILERLHAGEFRRAENELLALVSAARLRTQAARVLALQGLARIQLWARADFRGAFTTLAPLLADVDAGRLSPEVELEVHVTAALVFSAIDGRFFDAGKANAHVARAERLLAPGSSSTARFLLWLAQVIAANVTNDPPLLQHALARSDEVAQDLSSPLLRCFSYEVQAISGLFQGHLSRVAQLMAKMVSLARQGALHLVYGRALAQAARQWVDDGEDPRRVLSTTQEIHALCRESHVVPGWHSLLLAYADAEAYLRLGRWAESEAALADGMRAGEEISWSYGGLPLFLCRLLLLRGRAHEIRPLAERVLNAHPRIYPEISRAIAEAVACIADVVEGKGVQDAVDRLDGVVRRLESVWSYLRRNVLLANAAVAVLAGTGQQAERALRRVERELDTTPCLWGSGVVRWLKGVHLLREGVPGEALPLLEGAIGTFALAQDALHGALGEWALSHARARLGEAGAQERVAGAEAALAALGVTGVPSLERRAQVQARPAEEAAGPAQVQDGALARVFPPLQRLAVRGLSPSRIEKELLGVLGEVLPRLPVRLDEVDSRGEVTSIGAGGGGSDIPANERVEFGDGAGRRLVLATGQAMSPDTRALVSLAATMAGLSLEVANLRGLSDRSALNAPGDGVVPEIPGFVSASSVMRKLKLDLARLSRSRSTVVITGESGSGKEVVARAIHDLSVRAGKPYVAFNCAAVPRDLFEGQLFGYRKGAFTGAASDHAGVIRAAEGGTLFLDEIGELPLDVQPKLLRFLENGEVFPLGDRKPLRVDVRVLVATFRDLEKLVREGRFREDLFYRLQVVQVHVPPLRERPEDIVALARHFVHAYTPTGQDPPVLGPDAVASLIGHAWPGNVRELRNVIERSLAFEPLPPLLRAEHLRLGGR